MFAQAEPIARVVPKHSCGSPGLFLRRTHKLNALRGKFLISRLAIRRVEHTSAELALLNQLAHLIGAGFVKDVPRFGLSQYYLEVRLILRADGQPAIAAVHGCVGPNFKPELVRIKLE